MPIQMMEIYKIDITNCDTEWRKHFLTTYNTCFYLYFYDNLVEFVTRCMDILRKVVDSLSQAVKRLVKTFEELFDLDSSMKFSVKKSYPHIYPHSVDNLKFNSRGYPLSIRPCARSRC